MLRTLLSLAVGGVLLLSVAGCVRGPIPQEPAKGTQPATDEAQKKLLEEIHAYQQQSGATLESLAKEIARRKAMEAEAVGPSPLQRDLAVARALLVAARRAAQSQDSELAGALLRRLGATVDVMQGETPAAQIRTYLERAALALQGSAAGIEADVASACVLAATDVALKSPDATLVPEIAKDLEKVKGSIDKGEYKDSLRVITELAKTVSSHKSVIMLEHAEAGVRGAREAMGRDAAYVVLAELDQLSDLFSNFATMMRGAPPAPDAGTAEAEKPATENKAPAEGAGSATPTTETGQPAAAGAPAEGAAAGGTKPAPAKPATAGG